MAGVGFGLEGVSQAETDIYREAQTAETLGKIAQQPYEMRKKAAEAEEKELEVAGRRRMAARAAQRGTGGLEGVAGGTPQSAGELAASTLYQHAQDAIDSGLPELGGKIANQASLVRQHEAATKNAQANAQLHTIQSEIKAAELLARRVNVDTVRDQASWDRAWAQVGVEVPGAYSPQRVAEIQRAALSEHERLTNEERRLSRESADRLRRARIEDIIDRKPLVAAQTAQAEARAKVLGREGGGDFIKPAVLKEATDLITSKWDGVGADEAGMLGRDIVREARRLAASNEALSYPEALSQALGRAEEAGVFESFQPRKAGQPRPGKITPPSRDNQRSAMALLMSEVPELKDNTERQAAAGAIAARAKVLQRTREPDWDRALKMALDEEVAAGALPTTRDVPLFKRRGYRSGAVPEKGRSLPSDPTLWQKDLYYTDSKGETRKYLGGGKWGEPVKGK